MPHTKVLWHPSEAVVFYVILAAGLTCASARAGSEDDSAESLQWYKLRCYQVREPYRFTRRELHPQLFVAKSHIYKVNPWVALFVPQSVNFTNAKKAHIVCTSRQLVGGVTLTRIPCPFVVGSQAEIKATWSFVPSKRPNASRGFQIPAHRSFYNYLNVENLTTADEGLYTCVANIGRDIWIEKWHLKRHPDSNSWKLTWNSANGDTKVYRLRDSREVTTLPFASNSWLEERLVSVNNSDYI